MTLTHIPKALHDRFEFYESKHAVVILRHDFPEEWSDIMALLDQFKLCRSYITTPGGSKSKVALFVDQFLTARGWSERGFRTAITVDDAQVESPTHKVDCFKNRVALEVEWNNKDPFFDRDLNNFRLLFDLRVISVGVIITRCDELQVLFNQLGRGASYGASTTHLSKLMPRIQGGGGGGCPLLVIGIRPTTYVEEC